MYHDPRTGYSGIKTLKEQSNLPTKVVRGYLQSQDIYTKFKPANKTFSMRRFYSLGIDKIWQADIVFMPKEWANINDNYIYLLLVICTFSKFLWAIPLKTKSSAEVKQGFQTIFETSKRHCESLNIDKGTEFKLNTEKYLNELKIKFYSTENETKAMIVERVALTLQQIMWKYLDDHKTTRWIDKLDDFVYNYNNRVHSSIKMTPTEASKPENESTVYKNLYGANSRLNRQQHYVENEKSVFKLEDSVRITKYGTKFDRGYHPNFLEEIYTISKILETQPITYKIIDYSGEEVKGSFYKEQLSRYDKPDDQFDIQYVLQYDTKLKMAYVKWEGYPDKFNSWISFTEEQLEISKNDGHYRPDKLPTRLKHTVRTKAQAAKGK